MFKLLMNVFFDVTGAIFFILKIVVVGIGRMFVFLVDAVVSSTDRDQDTDYLKTEPKPARFDKTSIRIEDQMLSHNTGFDRHQSL